MTDTDRRKIQTLLDRYEAALNASDVDAVAELYSDDGVFLPSSAPTAVGIEAGTKPNLAKLTIARKIAAIVLAIWKTETEYQIMS